MMLGTYSHSFIERNNILKKAVTGAALRLYISQITDKHEKEFPHNEVARTETLCKQHGESTRARYRNKKNSFAAGS
jgi:hypothetical protein